MLRLTEEPGMVRGNEIHQLLDLILTVVGSENGAVVVKGNQPQRPQPLSQPVGQHGLFIWTEPDATMLVHEVGQRPISFGRKSGRERRMHSREPDPADCRLRNS